MNYILIVLGAIIYYITMPLWIWFVLFAKESEHLDLDETWDGDIIDQHGRTYSYDKNGELYRI